MTLPIPAVPEPWWWRSDVTPATREPLREDVTADVAIVGGGVVGCTLARRLAQDGFDVVVLEAARIGAGSTGSSTAKLTALQNPRYARLERQQGSDVARAYARASVAAVEEVVRVLDDLDPDAVERATAVTWTQDPGTASMLVDERGAAARSGLPVRSADGDSEWDALAAIALDDQAMVHPVRWLAAIADDAASSGARFYERSRVQRVGLRGRPRVVETDEGSVRAPHVVVATGYSILDRGGWFARAEAQRAYALVVSAPRVPVTMGLGIGGGTRSARPLRPVEGGSGLVMVAGEDHRAGWDDGNGSARYERLADWAATTFGADEVLARWSAQDWEPADHLPMIGPILPGDDAVLAAGGFDKWGLTSGVAAARLLHDHIIGRTGDEHAVFDPRRMRPRAAAAGILRDNAKVAQAMASGWLSVLAHGGTPELGDGEGRVERDGRTPVARARVDGEEYRCSAVCTHMGGIVRWRGADRAWACPLHGSRFDVDGTVTWGPATRDLPPR